MKVLTVVGARPQFIKAVPVSLALQRAGLEEVLVHTGQHYDFLMSDVFFESLGLAAPKYNLRCGPGRHGQQTAAMLERLEGVILDERPQLVLVYGDTNSTLAGALAAAKLNVPVGHVEAGLRSFNRTMPEEINRVVADHLSDLLFAPTDAAVLNLRREGLEKKVVRTGDVMFDTVRLIQEQMKEQAETVVRALGLERDGFFLATVHRAENTDDEARWHSIVSGLLTVAERVAPVVWPVHPRVRDRIEEEWAGRMMILDPLPYFEMQALVQNARAVLTDSGGVQKEAAFHETPCITLRDETEWVELLDAGVNVLVGASERKLLEAARHVRWPEGGIPPALYGDGNTAHGIAAAVCSFLESARGSADREAKGAADLEGLALPRPNGS